MSTKGSARLFDDEQVAHVHHVNRTGNTSRDVGERDLAQRVAAEVVEQAHNAREEPRGSHRVAAEVKHDCRIRAGAAADQAGPTNRHRLRG